MCLQPARTAPVVLTATTPPHRLHTVSGHLGGSVLFEMKRVGACLAPAPHKRPGHSEASVEPRGILARALGLLQARDLAGGARPALGSRPRSGPSRTAFRHLDSRTDGSRAPSPQSPLASRAPGSGARWRARTPWSTCRSGADRSAATDTSARLVRWKCQPSRSKIRGLIRKPDESS